MESTSHAKFASKVCHCKEPESTAGAGAGIPVAARPASREPPNTSFQAPSPMRLFVAMADIQQSFVYICMAAYLNFPKMSSSRIAERRKPVGGDQPNSLNFPQQCWLVVCPPTLLLQLPSLTADASPEDCSGMATEP